MRNVRPRSADTADGPTVGTETADPLECLARVLVHIPAPRLAPSQATRRWAALRQQSFALDPLACPSCHGAMRVVAFITQASVIDQILAHLRARAARETHAGPRSPPSTRAPTIRGASRSPRPPAIAPTAP